MSAIRACRCAAPGRHGGVQVGATPGTRPRRLTALRLIQLRRLVWAGLLRPGPGTCWIWPDLAGARAPSDPLARGALATGAPECRGGYWNPSCPYRRRSDFLLSIAERCALAVGARRDWQRHLLRASPGAGTTLPRRPSRDHERRRHDGGSCTAARSGTLR